MNARIKYILGSAFLLLFSISNANAELIYSFNQISGSFDFGGQIQISVPLSAWSVVDPTTFDKVVIDIPGLLLPNVDLLVDDYFGFGQVAPTRVIAEIHSLDGQGIDG